ncbi:MAG: thioredoxin family protein [Ramlibacter sp.]
MSVSVETPTPQWWVICLCAEWCGVCRDWRGAFEQAAALHPDVRFAWIDIEDDSQAMGDVEIDTFPTLLVAQGGIARFFGPVPPSPAQITRLLSGLSGIPDSAGLASESQVLLQRLLPLVSR